MDSNEGQANLSLDGSINDLARKKFAEIKNKMKLNMFEQKVVSEDYPQKDVDVERIQELLNHPEQNDKFEVKNEAVQEEIESAREFVDQTFVFIDSLNVSDKVKLALGNLIAAFHTFDDEYYNKAMEALEEEYNAGKEKENNN